MNKAMEYAKHRAEADVHKPRDLRVSIVPGLTDAPEVTVASITGQGACEILMRAPLSPFMALALRDWLTENFDERCFVVESLA